MDIKIKFDTKDVDWEKVSGILQSVGMAYYVPEKHRNAFQASYCSVFLYDANELIGFGRAISDGVYQAAIYDCAVSEKYQGRGLGRRIIDEILAKLPDCNVILYASPGKESFYKKFGFRKMMTGMARFVKSDRMAEKGFTE